MSGEKPGLDNPPPYTAQYGADFGGSANPPQGMPYPQQGGQGMAYPPPQQGMTYPPPQQGMGYPQPQQGMGFPQQPGYNQNMQTNTTSVIVNQPGAAGYVIQQPRPPNYMVSSIIACLCCFWPTGLCAIYYASRANSLAAEGDMVGATNMANNARSMMITSIVIGIIWISLVIVLRSIEYSNYSNRY